MFSTRRLFAQPARAASGVRRLDLLRDVDAIAELVEVAFRDEPGRDVHGFRSELRSLRSVAPVIWGLARCLPGGSDLLTGYVFEQSGRIGGCLTLSRLPGRPVRWLVANVAVHPEFRRRGIARRLMEASILHVRERGGGLIVLDVRRENEPAYALYQNLGFTLRQETAEWRWLPGATWSQALPASTVPADPATARFKPLPAADLRRVQGLIFDAVPEPAREAAAVAEPDAYGLLLLGPLIDVRGWFTGRQIHRLAAGAGDRLDGLVVVQATRHFGIHEVQIVIRPGYEAALAAEAVGQAVATLRRFPPLPVTATLRAPSQPLLDALEAVGFRERQTLHRLALRVVK